MIARCAVTEAAARLSLELEAYSIPDDFQPEGKYRQVVARVRTSTRITGSCSYPCPPARLQIAARSRAAGAPVTTSPRRCWRSKPRRLAIGVYACWEARHAANKADKLTLALAE